MFTLLSMLMFEGINLKWNHVLAFLLLVASVYLVFME
ncbi:hypothetical protein [uncultured Muribaculum sp.]|nr:hypothetical protein [uncultured Muribaculum sp.]